MASGLGASGLTMGPLAGAIAARTALDLPPDRADPTDRTDPTDPLDLAPFDPLR